MIVVFNSFLRAIFFDLEIFEVLGFEIFEIHLILLYYTKIYPTINYNIKIYFIQSNF